MEIQQQIADHIASLSESKGKEVQALHKLILQEAPDVRLWFDTGKDETGKTVTNPTIGYGFQVIKYADGKTKDFFRVGISGNTAGISVYILGLEDKKYLINTYGDRLGKASVTGYCIKFKKLADIDIDVLMEAIQFGLSL